MTEPYRQTKTDPAENQKADTSVKSAGRILDILDLLALRTEPVSLAEVRNVLALPKSSALLLLRTLVSRGYAMKNAEGRYYLDPILNAGGADWVGGPNCAMLRLVRPVMLTLSQAVRETVLYGVMQPDLTVRLVEKCVSPQVIRYDTDIANPVPAYCTAIGRSILAYSPTDFVEYYIQNTPMPPLTASTIVEPDAFRASLRHIREQGFAVNFEERMVGASSVAAPFFDSAGKVLGAINVGCVTSSFVEHRETILENLLSNVQDLTSRLRQINGVAA
nr:IclR family transcriptional regulator [Acetobacter musti]